MTILIENNTVNWYLALLQRSHLFFIKQTTVAKKHDFIYA